MGELLSISVGQVYWWSNRWQAEGLAGLADKPRNGRPLSSRATVQTQVAQLMETDPQSLGYGFTVWTAGRLLRHLRG